MSEPIIVAGRECHFLDCGHYWRIADRPWNQPESVEWLCGDGQWHTWLVGSPDPNQWPTEAAAREFALARSQPGKGDTDGWRTIDSAPKDGTRVLLCVAGEKPSDYREYYHLANWNGEYWQPFIPNDWTHWMPLPAAPAGG